MYVLRGTRLVKSSIELFWCAVVIAGGACLPLLQRTSRRMFGQPHTDTHTRPPAFLWQAGTQAHKQALSCDVRAHQHVIESFALHHQSSTTPPVKVKQQHGALMHVRLRPRSNQCPGEEVKRLNSSSTEHLHSRHQPPPPYVHQAPNHRHPATTHHHLQNPSPAAITVDQRN
mgnify:CR=1 FL=1